MITHESLHRDLARLIIWYPFRWLIGVLPLRTGLKLIELVGDVHSLLSLSTSRRIRVTAEAIIGLEQADTQRSSPSEYYRTYYRSQLIAFLFPKLNPSSIETIHSFQGLAQLDPILKQGTGCIIVHCHFGPIHLPLFHLGLKKYPVKQLGFLRRPAELSAVGERVSFRLRQKLEALIPAEIIQADSFQRATFKHLRAGGVLLTTGDGAGRGDVVGQQHNFAFLGRTRDFPLGPARLALKTKAVLLPMFTVAGATPQTFVSHIGTPLDTASGDEHAITQSFVTQFEAHIRQTPCHWHFLDEWATT